jgi:hypothetical protein
MQDLGPTISTHVTKLQWGGDEILLVRIVRQICRTSWTFTQSNLLIRRDLAADELQKLKLAANIRKVASRLLQPQLFEL